MRKTRIAIQKAGRLTLPSLEFLRNMGLSLPNLDGDELVVKCENREVEVLFIRNSDIPVYIEQDAADFGIVGRNVLTELNAGVKELESLNFGQCSLVIAVAEASGCTTLTELEGERIATSYPRTLKRFLKERNINASIVPIQGSVEIAIQAGLADAICDITQSGKTLCKNRLRVLETVLSSQACLIGNLNSKVFEI